MRKGGVRKCLFRAGEDPYVHSYLILSYLFSGRIFASTAPFLLAEQHVLRNCKLRIATTALCQVRSSLTPRGWRIYRKITRTSLESSSCKTLCPSTTNLPMLRSIYDFCTCLEEICVFLKCLTVQANKQLRGTHSEFQSQW